MPTLRIGCGVQQRFRVVGVQEHPPLVCPESEDGAEPGADHVCGQVELKHAVQVQHMAGKPDASQGDCQADGVEDDEKGVFTS